MIIEISNVGCFESDNIIGISSDYSTIQEKKVVRVLNDNDGEDEDLYKDEVRVNYVNKYRVTITYSSGNSVVLYSTCPCLYKRVKSYLKNADILSKPSRIVSLTTGQEIQVDYIKKIQIKEKEIKVSDGWFKTHTEKHPYLEFEYLDPNFDHNVYYESNEDFEKDVKMLREFVEF